MVQEYVTRRLKYSNPAPPHACLEGDVDTLLGNHTHLYPAFPELKTNLQSIVNGETTIQHRALEHAGLKTTQHVRAHAN